ncbi:MAG: hydantoinase/oxoprolinase family protein, partial [Bacillota bacterium]
MTIVGIDVGGTNTDAALIQEGRILATAKVRTHHDRLLDSTTLAFEKLLDAYGSTELSGPMELHLSTTLSTNAIIEGKGDPTAVLAVPGPGMNIVELDLGFPIYVLSGSVDHRGREVAPINREEVMDAINQALNSGATAVAAVGKFSHRNPAHELEIEKLILERISERDTDDAYAEKSILHKGSITLGHRLSGRPNFPRRMATAYLNASIARRQALFVDMIRKFLVRGKNVTQVFLLKADGGTMQLEDSLVRPVETILSGPAASIMGAEALSAYPDSNTVIVDIGGTTTDISVQVKGETVFQRQGAEISGFKTLVPALFSRSIGLGGDSEIRVVRHSGAGSVGDTIRSKMKSVAQKETSVYADLQKTSTGAGEPRTHTQDIDLEIGPKRAGTPAAFGGDCVTPT